MASGVHSAIRAPNSERQKPAGRQSSGRLPASRIVDVVWTPAPLAVTVLVGAVSSGAIGLATGCGAVGAAVLAAVTGTAAAMFWAHCRRKVHRDFTTPLVELRLSIGEPSVDHLPEAGAMPVENLAHRLNEVLSVVLESNRQSQAQLLSVEVAFDRIHSVLHSLVEGVVVVDALGEVVLANPAARGVFVGQNGKPVEGRSLPILLDGELRQAVTAGLAEFETDAGDHVTRAGVVWDERVFDLDILRVHSNRQDQDFGVVVVFRDVTTSYEVQSLKDEFLSSVSHELRTPLTNICAYAEILTLMRPGEDKEWSEFLKIIHDEGQRLTGLVDRVLDYSAFETGKIVWDVEELRFAEAIGAAVATFQHKAGRANVMVTADFAADAVVRVDRARLLQAVGNVLDNALEVTPPGKRILVRLASTDGGRRIEAVIHDAGPGVPEDLREKIFERLFQLGDTLTEKPAGAGLGLSIAQAIVEHFGGTLRCADSQDLGGASFHIELPVAVAVAVAAAGDSALADGSAVADNVASDEDRTATALGFAAARKAAAARPEA